MLRNTTSLTLLTTLAATLPAPELACQEPTPTVIHEPRAYTLDFQGGSLADFAAAIRSAAIDPSIWHDPRPVNIVMPETAGSVQVPPIQLTGVSVRDALRAVGQILQLKVRIDIATYQDRPDMGPVHAVAIGPIGGFAPPQPSLLRVFSLASLAAVPGVPDEGVSVSAETALTAIETGLSLDSDSDATMRYHEDSRLLFVRGTPEQVAVVDSVLSQLERDVSILRQRAMRSRGGNRGARGGQPPEVGREVPSNPSEPSKTGR